MKTPYDPNALGIRVSYAAQCIRKDHTGGRSFDTCFEMYDGEYVVTFLVRKAEHDLSFASALLKYWRGDVNYGSWRGTAEKYKGVSDKALREAARAHRITEAAIAKAQYPKYASK